MSSALSTCYFDPFWRHVKNSKLTHNLLVCCLVPSTWSPFINNNPPRAQDMNLTSDVLLLPAGATLLLSTRGASMMEFHTSTTNVMFSGRQYFDGCANQEYFRTLLHRSNACFTTVELLDLHPRFCLTPATHTAYLE